MFGDAACGSTEGRARGLWRRAIDGTLVLMLLVAGVPRAAIGQGGGGGGAAASAAVSPAAAVARGVDVILEMQEAPDGPRGAKGAAGGEEVEAQRQDEEARDRAEWPYEGVYRVRGAIPIGYRVGGTAIAASALLEAAGYEDDARRQAAVRRATAFVTASVDDPFMTHRVSAQYDVRGWGYAYGLLYLLRLKQLDAVPEALGPDVERAIRFFIDGIAATAIPESGGWNYARRAGFDRPGPASTFMTAPTLQALFEAAQAGYEVDPDLVESGLDALENARLPSGAFNYAGTNSGNRSQVPGAAGRMAAAEATLYLAGRSSLDRVRGAIDAFIVHWTWLDRRRARDGTHEGPYGIAPYYFYYAHYYAAQAIELLPPSDRREYRRRLAELLFSVRQNDGRWNDRVFPRSANYGTAMAVRALSMPFSPPPAHWPPPPREEEPKPQSAPDAAQP